MSSETIEREHYEITGIVQGVGFRPFVFALARRFGLGGFVRNHASGVTIEVEGLRGQLAQFAGSLRSESPPLARIDSVAVSAVPPAGCQDFRIVQSESQAGASTPISPDIATCEECLAEMSDKADRRYRYPFINCTNCGPRYTIVHDIPYDRARTSMRDFAMCADCDREYRDPKSRRFHAEPNACPRCGPILWFVGGAQADDGSSIVEIGGCRGELAIEAFHRCIAADEIVATKGIGGFHLACAAESTVAIRKLRERKGRVDKPLAIMVADVAAARRIAEVAVEEERLLCSRERPIVLLRRRADCSLPAEIAPGNHWIGIMLPYSPLHALLVERGPLVMTSGNLSEEPIVRSNEEAFERLRPLADAFLLHNREIHVVCDDSVVRVSQGRELPIRRSRGYAPLPIRLPGKLPQILAVGGELKSTFCLTKDNYAYLSPHLGDMGNLETLEAFRRAVEHFQKLFRSDPEIVACDLHPGYLSSQWAREYARSKGLKLMEVQHHHAHIASALAEHNVDRGRTVIGVSLDGTGFGQGGAIWGGEVLLASCREFRRWAHLKYVPLPGGDASVRHPYRSALAHLFAAQLPWDERLPCVAHCSAKERTVLRRQLERNLNCAPTSSMGRLFDAVAALIGIRQSVSYEAQAAIEMEVLSADVRQFSPYPFAVLGDVPHQIDPGPLLAAIVNDVIADVPREVIAGRFHRSVVQIIVDLCIRARQRTGLHQVALSGGVFQNQWLLEHTVECLEEAGFEVLTHGIVPPNDGGLALGQAIIAATSSPSSSIAP